MKNDQEQLLLNIIGSDNLARIAAARELPSPVQSLCDDIERTKVRIQELEAGVGDVASMSQEAKERKLKLCRLALVEYEEQLARTAI